MEHPFSAILPEFIWDSFLCVSLQSGTISGKITVDGDCHGLIPTQLLDGSACPVHGLVVLFHCQPPQLWQLETLLVVRVRGLNLQSWLPLYWKIPLIEGNFLLCKTTGHGGEVNSWGSEIQFLIHSIVLDNHKFSLLKRKFLMLYQNVLCHAKIYCPVASIKSIKTIVMQHDTTNYCKTLLQATAYIFQTCIVPLNPPDLLIVCCPHNQCMCLKIIYHNFQWHYIPQAAKHHTTAHILIHHQGNLKISREFLF